MRALTPVPVIYVNDALDRWDGDAPVRLREAIDLGRGGGDVSPLAPAPGEATILAITCATVEPELERLALAYA